MVNHSSHPTPIASFAADMKAAFTGAQIVYLKNREGVVLRDLRTWHVDGGVVAVVREKSE